MEGLGEAAKLYVWGQIIASVIVAPFAIYAIWQIFKRILKEWDE
jgi:hypothetical protein